MLYQCHIIKILFYCEKVSDRVLSVSVIVCVIEDRYFRSIPIYFLVNAHSLIKTH